MKYDPIDKSLFILNRERFVQHMKPNSIAIFNSNDIMPTSADGTRPFIQQTDLFYLSGIDQEETVLLLYPDCKEEKLREVLFIKETSELIAIWEGNKLTMEEAREKSGVQTVYWNDKLESMLGQMVFEAAHIYLNTNEHLRATAEVQTRDDRFREWCRHKYPLHHYERSAPIMHEIRAVKSKLEIGAIQKAADITEAAFRRVLGFVKPGVWEYEIEAEITHEFLKSRSRGPAYDSIIASGASSCVLHYVENSRQCKDGDVLLMDFGAEYANYAADLTRTIPVNGRFSQRQKDIYNAVLKVHKEAVKLLVPGNNLKDYTEEVSKITENELIGLGLLDKTAIKNQDPENPLYKKYFMHGVSHHLGLDVHDYGNKYRKFEAGMVFTCEPGIYVREEGIGVRIENDILVTEDGPVDLMANIPIEVEEIEGLMNP